MECLESLQKRVGTLEHRAFLIQRRCRALPCAALVLVLVILPLSPGMAQEDSTEEGEEGERSSEDAGLTPSHIINCGDVLGPGGFFQLGQDLDCSTGGFNGPTLTVRDGAILDLNWHSVTCESEGFECITLTGSRARLLNGLVQRGLHVRIALKGSGRHTVRNVTSPVIDDNIVVESDNTRLINITAESGVHPAFRIGGNHNLLTGSIALCLDVTGCIEVFGHENRLVDNFATSLATSIVEQFPFAGFFVGGNNNQLRRNRAMHNQNGIVVTGMGNDLTRNTAVENSLDLRDQNGDCAHNTWTSNIFETSDPACIR
jgi:parallel beta-helix repeat protein